MKRNFCLLTILCLSFYGCGGGESNPDPLNNNDLPSQLSHSDGANYLQIDNLLFNNLSQFVQLPKIELNAVVEQDKLLLKTDSNASNFEGTLAVFKSAPNGDQAGVICTYRIPGVLTVTGTGDINVELTGALSGQYTIKECNVSLNINSSSTEWAAIRTQNFGPQQASIVFNDGIKMSKHVNEDTTLLYIEDYADTVVNQFNGSSPWPVLANENRGIICMNVNQFIPEYVSYFTPKITLDTNPPAGYTTDGLTAVTKPVAFLSNCLFEAQLWSDLWENN